MDPVYWIILCSLIAAGSYFYGKKIHANSNPYSKLNKTEHPADQNYDKELDLIKDQLEQERARQR